MIKLIKKIFVVLMYIIAVGLFFIGTHHFTKKYNKTKNEDVQIQSRRAPGVYVTEFQAHGIPGTITTPPPATGYIPN